MKTTKNFLIYYNEERELIGLREHHFDWEEGDVYQFAMNLKGGQS